MFCGLISECMQLHAAIQYEVKQIASGFKAVEIGRWEHRARYAKGRLAWDQVDNELSLP